MKLYVSNLESHICLDDEQKTITTVTSSSIFNNCAFAVIFVNFIESKL
jgi:hypothetical protein